METAAVFDRAAKTYELVGPKFFSHFGQRLVNLVGVEAGARVLDVATGAGAILLPAAERVGPRGKVVGIDLARGMVERLRKELARREVYNAEVRLMDAQELAFADGSFDCVLCGFALDLDGFPKPHRALSEFNRVLRPGGRLGLSVSSGWWWEGDERWAWHGKLLKSLGAGVRSGPTGFATPQETESALAAGGFREISVSEEKFELLFADEEEWWRWAWSHGYRRVLEAMDGKSREDYRAACFAQLHHRVDPRGIPGRLVVLLATAAKPVSEGH